MPDEPDRGTLVVKPVDAEDQELLTSRQVDTLVVIDQNLAARLASHGYRGDVLIIQSHGGRLWATPNVPQGAIFQFSLPVRGEEPV